MTQKANRPQRKLADLEADATLAVPAGPAEAPEVDGVPGDQGARVVTELETAGALKSYEAPPLDGRALERALRSLEVGAEIRPRFTLDDAFDQRLEPLRTRVRALRREETRQSRAHREETEARWGFRVHSGTIRVPTGHLFLPAMLASAGLEVAAAGPIETEFRLVPSPELAALREQVEADDAALAVVEEEVVAALGRRLEPVGDGLLATQAWIGRLDFRLAKVLGAPGIRVRHPPAPVPEDPRPCFPRRRA